MTRSHRVKDLQNINQAKAETARGFVLVYAYALQCTDDISLFFFHTASMFLGDEIKRMVIDTAELYLDTPHGVIQTFLNEMPVTTLARSYLWFSPSSC